MVMAAGLGTRLRPLTYVRAKPAVPVAGEPLVRRILRWLARHGVRDAVLNVHHMPGTVRAAVGDDAGALVRVRYSAEDAVLGTAGGPRHALPLLGAGRFFIVNGDTLTDLDLGALLEAHERAGALVTLALVPNPAPARYGGVEIDDRGRVVRFVRARGAGTGAHLFVGVQVVEASVFAGLPDNVPAESVGQLYPTLLAERPGSIRGAVCDASFLDIGTPDDYLEASLLLRERESSGGLPAGARTTIDPSAEIDRSVLWDDVAIEARVRLSECVVTDRVRVPEGTALARTVLTPVECGPPLPGSTRFGQLLLTPLAPAPGHPGGKETVDDHRHTADLR